MRYFAYDPNPEFNLGAKSVTGKIVDAICIDQQKRTETYFAANGEVIPAEELRVLEIVRQQLADEHDPWFITT